MAGPLSTALKRRIDYHRLQLARLVDPFSNGKKAVTLRNQPWPSSITGDGLVPGSMLLDPIEQDHWIAACVRAKNDWLTPIPLIVYQNKNPVGPTDPIQKLFLKPNAMMTRAQLLESIMTWQNIDGSCFLLGDWGMGIARPGSGPPKALWPFSGDKFYPIKSGGEVTGWRFLHPGTFREMKLLNEEIIRFWRFNPRSPLHDKGQSLMTPAVRAIAVSYAAQAYELDYVQNYGMPYAALETEQPWNKEWADEQREEWKKVHGRRVNSRQLENIAILMGGLSLKQYAATIKDLRPDTLHEAAREAALSTLGVPPAIVGVLRHANWSNMKEQIVIMLRGVIRADLIRIEERFNADFFPRFAPNKYCKFDMSIFPELERDLKERVEIAKMLFQDMGIPLKQIEQLLNLGLNIKELGALADTSFLPMNLLPMGMVEREKIMNMLRAKHLGALFEEKPIEIFPTIEKTWAPINEKYADIKRIAKTAEKIKRGQAQAQRQAQIFRRKLRPIENECADKVHTWFYRQRQTIIGNIMDRAEEIAASIPETTRREYRARKMIEDKASINGTIVAPAYKDLSDEFEALIKELMPADMELQANEVATMVVSFSEKGIDLAGQMHAAEIAAMGFEISAYNHEFIKAATYLANRKSIFAESVMKEFDRVHGMMMRGFLEGESAATIAREVRDQVRAWGNQSQAKAMLWARTEVVGAGNNGRYQAMEESGVKYKGWAHGYGVKAPREHHAALDGAVIPFDEYFDVGGKQCKEPHDWDGAGAEEWCNCGCSLYTPTYDPDTGREFTPDELFGGEENIPSEIII